MHPVWLYVQCSICLTVCLDVALICFTRRPVVYNCLLSNCLVNRVPNDSRARLTTSPIPNISYPKVSSMNVRLPCLYRVRSSNISKPWERESQQVSVRGASSGSTAVANDGQARSVSLGIRLMGAVYSNNTSSTYIVCVKPI